MNEINPGNEKIKRRYLRHLKGARGLAESTIDNALRAIAAYEGFTGYRDFGKFRSTDAEAYKKRLLSDGGRRAAEISNRSTIHGKLQPLQRFFTWLADQDGFRTKLRFCDAEFFNLSNRDLRIARDRPPKPAPTLEQVQHAILSMPASTDLEKRDRALVACALLTGARVKALITLKLKHVRLDRLGIDQDARQVATKFSRTYTTIYFPVGNDIRQIFFDYVDYLRGTLKRNGEDPLFPKTELRVGDEFGFHSTGLTREHWATPDPVRDAFHKAFASAGLPYYSPHSIRRTLTLLGQQRCRTPEDLKAWSQNLGHLGVLTTFTSYGGISMPRQTEIITSLAEERDADEAAFAAFLAMRHDPRFAPLFRGSSSA
jgi:site-specific recombinase XerD